MNLTPHAARFDELDAASLYALLQLRVDVFVVEQKCPYPDLDGRDTEPDTLHLWINDGDRPAAYLRIVSEPDGVARIGRVVVRGDARGNGLAARLLVDALGHIGDRPCELHAQSYLAGFYSRFGFAVTGPEFLDDGIPHVPMRREPQAV